MVVRVPEGIRILILARELIRAGRGLPHACPSKIRMEAIWPPLLSSRRRSGSLAAEIRVLRERDSLLWLTVSFTTWGFDLVGLHRPVRLGDFSS